MSEAEVRNEEIILTDRALQFMFLSKALKDLRRNHFGILGLQIMLSMMLNRF
jgi:hypothetical protein